MTNYYASDGPCLPSRTALFTSRFGIHTGVVNHGGLQADPRRYGHDRGFGYPEKFQTVTRALRQAGLHTVSLSPFPHRHDAIQVLEGFAETHDPGDTHAPAHFNYEYAEEWLTEHATEDDWFLHVNFWDPHTEYNTPAEFGNPFEDESAPEWLTQDIIDEHYAAYGPHSALTPQSTGDDWSGTYDCPRMPEKISNRNEFKQWIDGYDVGIRYMDQHIGKILDLLREAGIYEETLVIVSADHGENLGELNVYGDHHTADEYTCNVPLILRGPDVEPGIDEEFHYQIDLGPTLVDLVDGEVRDGWDGRSFVETVIDGEPAGRDYLVVSHGAWSCQRGVRWDDWILLRTYHDGCKPLLEDVMLFDLADDPHETENLAEERPKVVEEGLAKLQRWHDERLTEAAHGENGGNPNTPDGVTDPIWEVIREGGPFHVRGSLGPYAEHLRRIGRDDQADEIEAKYDIDR